VSTPEERKEKMLIKEYHHTSELILKMGDKNEDIKETNTEEQKMKKN
jgi:hypothetical protein